jgi:hypothetical protein
VAIVVATPSCRAAVPRLRRRPPFWQVRGEQPPPLSASRRPLPKLTCHLARACGHPRQTRRAR